MYKSDESGNPSAGKQATNDETFAEFRSGFPALKSLHYASVCDKMILHDTVRAAVDLFMDKLALASANRLDHEVYVAGARAKFAQMMNVAEDTIAAVRNVSDGINSIAWAMPWNAGDNLVICASAEHPNNSYPWLRLKRRGVELRIVPPLSTGETDVDAMIKAMDGKTRLATCASVTFAPGHRTDIEKLAVACERADVFLAVDGVQSAGIMSHDLSAVPISGFATSSSKGLLGLYGFGFLYVAPKWIDRLEPAYLSRPAVLMQNDDHSAMGDFDYTLHPGTRRFEVGSYNLAGAYAVEAALTMLLQLGVANIERRVLALAAELNEALRATAFEPSVSEKSPALSHVITSGTLDNGGHGFSHDPRITQASQALNEAGVVHSVRRGQLRFGLHAYNDSSDINAIRTALQQV